MASLFDAFSKAGFKSREEPSRSTKNPPQKKYSAQKTSPNISSRQATAPYNFVSLPEKVLPAQFENVEGFREHIGSEGNISGEILLDIEALTPLFIGGGGSKSFAPVGTPIIPGSSLRGMFKNIFKIVTCGAFRGRTSSQKKGEDFNDEHIYFRCLMGVGRYPWTKDLNKLYVSRMIHSAKGKDGKLHPVKNARPGFLICTTDNRIFIAPSIYKSDRKDDRILIREYEKKFRTTIPERNSSCVKWDGTTAYIITGSQARFKLLDENRYELLQGDEKKRAGKQFIRYTRLEYVDWSREHWFEVADDVLNSYRHDRNRRGVDLLKSKDILNRADLERLTGKTLPDVKTLIPCHFLIEDEQVTAFGHGQCFRIPYRQRIGDAVKISGNELIDFADAVFGRSELWSSRIYFEDAIAEEFSELKEATAHPLMQPNPTSYQLYLKQEQSGKLTNWDSSNAQVRGYKFYWHNAAPDWHASESELELDRGKSADKRLTKEITPLAKGSRLAAKIRFKNLSAVELGAVMMMFDLHGLKDAAYKIGQGKPFGFGSVRITPKLYIESDAAYTKFFDAEGWQNPYSAENPAEYLAAFKDYLTARGLFETWRKVMAEVKKILDWSLTGRKDWSFKIKAMSGEVSQAGGVDERFKQRDPLPSIFEVVK